MITATMGNHANRGKPGGAGMAQAANPTPAQIRATREAAGLTQAQAAELIHATRRAWENWEAENGDASRRMHPGLFELFKLKADYPDAIAKLLQATGRKR